MASYLTLLEQLSTAVDQLNEVLQGDENTTVTINGQQQPSVQKKTLDEVNAKIQLVLDAAADIDAVKYTSTEAGIANTVTDQFFSVVSQAESSYLDLYKNDAGVAKFEKTYPSKKALDDILVASNDLFKIDKENRFPAANLLVERFLTDGSTTSYSAGYSQLASLNGLNVAIPAQGSFLIKHYLRTGFMRVTGDITASYKITKLSDYGGVGLGYINGNGEYVFYSIGVSGNINRSVDADNFNIAVGIATVDLNDTLDISYKGEDIVFTHNGSVIYTHPASDDFVGEIIIGQLGFLEYTVKLFESSDPIRDWIKTYVASKMPDVPSLEGLISQESLTSQAAALFNSSTESIFPEANLTVRRYLTDGGTTEYGAGYAQSASPEGLSVNVTAAGSAAIKHFFRTGEQLTNRTSLKFSINSTPDGTNVGLGFIHSSGEYRAYTINSVGGVFELVNESVKTYYGEYQPYTIGDVVDVALNNSEISFKINDEVVYTLLLDEPISGELLIAQAGFPQYTVSKQSLTTPIHDYVKSEIKNKAVSNEQFKTSVSNLFFTQNVNILSGANLPVRRFLDGSFNDYSNGYSQAAGEDGVEILIPKSGSGLISHNFKLGFGRTFENFTQVFNIEGGDLNNLNFGLGWIDQLGNYVSYNYTFNGSVRKLTNYNDNVSFLAQEIKPLKVGDVLEITLTATKIIFLINGAAVFSTLLLEGEFGGELFFRQGGFGEGFSTKTVQSTDPVRSYVDSKVSSSESMYFELVAGQRLLVHTKSTGNKWVTYSLLRGVDTVKNYDAWGIGNMNESQFNGVSFYSSGRFPDNLSGTGSMEAPWKEVNAPTDFVSGSAHGDELTNGVILQVDGKEYDPMVDNVLLPCSAVRFVIDTTLFSNITPDLPIITRKRVYDFDQHGFDLEMQNTFLVDKTYTLLYYSSYSHPADVFSHYYIDKEFVKKPFLSVEREVKDDVRQYSMLGDNAALKVTVKSVEAGEINPRLLIAATNKIYFDLTNGAGANSRAVTAGDFWRIKSRYELKTF